ncbi:carotenoid oxygenase family protein [Paraburkholderia sp. D15]|uniref:carotenoid oxygenase family protein n=1 Tax=Paraburkholderia sp. D15 TaxID=2880218 RepID=UPI002478A759|nr:carotenoid oxygenase family protein [Paraburkholderia sp. D15]WGS54113.1 carotenoid oxygenase family protein [Paraburkholderia sp. D15]
MTTLDPHVGALAPVIDEVDLYELPVIGTLPEELDGVLMRNGPNPLNGRFGGNDMLSWWPEAAMLHAVSFRDGRALRYGNRWLRTKRWAHEYDAARASSMLDTNPNINVLAHAGEILALSEGGAPLAITTGLDTLGASRRHAGFAQGMSGHPKVDPRTGELVTFRAHWERPWLRYGVMDAQGNTSVEMEIDVPGASMMHDIAITATHSILFDLNVAFDFSMLSRGYRMPLRWHDERQARIGVIPRHGGTMRWFEVSPCMIMHVVNAFDVGTSIVTVDVVRYREFLRVSPDGAGFVENPLGALWRYVIDLERGTVTESPLDDLAIEMPRINEQRTGQDYRFFYAVEQPSNTEMRGVVRYDLERGSTQTYAVPAGDQNSEPVFVPRPGATNEDDGWLLVCVYRQASDTTDVVVLDARQIDGDPLATVRLPRRIPAGFHGAWVPGNA